MRRQLTVRESLEILPTKRFILSLVLMLPLLFPAPFVLLLERFATLPLLNAILLCLRVLLSACYQVQTIVVPTSRNDAHLRLLYGSNEFHCGFPGISSFDCEQIAPSSSLVLSRSLEGLIYVICGTMFCSMAWMFYSQPWNRSFQSNVETEHKKNN